MNRYLKVILKEMFKRVGVEFPKDESYFKKSHWFWSYEWTEKEEEDFKKWLIDYLKKHKEVRKDLMGIPSIDENFLKRFVNGFIMNYGWKIKK